MEKQEKIKEKIGDALESYYFTEVELNGGYPPLIDDSTIKGYVIVGGSHPGDNDKPLLDIYTWNQLFEAYKKWLGRAIEYQKEQKELGEEFDIDEALSDTMDYFDQEL